MMNLRKAIAAGLVAVIAFSLGFSALGVLNAIYNELAWSHSSAAATRFNILASAAQTATAQGGIVFVGGLSEIVITLDVTAASGTTPTLTVYLQASRDGGSTWFDLPHQGSLTLSAGTVQGNSVTAGNRNIISDQATTQKAIARYQVFGDYIRAAWVIGGTTPSFTFQIDAVGK